MLQTRSIKNKCTLLLTHKVSVHLIVLQNHMAVSKHTGEWPSMLYAGLCVFKI